MSGTSCRGFSAQTSFFAPRCPARFPCARPISKNNLILARRSIDGGEPDSTRCGLGLVRQSCRGTSGGPHRGGLGESGFVIPVRHVSEALGPQSIVACWVGTIVEGKVDASRLEGAMYASEGYRPSRSLIMASSSNEMAKLHCPTCQAERPLRSCLPHQGRAVNGDAAALASMARKPVATLFRMRCSSDWSADAMRS